MKNRMRRSRLPKKWSILFGIVLLLVAGESGWYAASPSSFPDPSLKVSVKNQHISAQIHHIPLQNVLSALSAQSPINFILQGIDPDVLISTSFTNLPLEKGLERLLLGYDYAIIHASSPSHSTATSARIREVVILSRHSNSGPIFSNLATLIPSPTIGQPYGENLQKERHAEDHGLFLETTRQKNEPELIPLLEQALGESDPETPQLVQELLNQPESVHE